MLLTIGHFPLAERIMLCPDNNSLVKLLIDDPDGTNQTDPEWMSMPSGNMLKVVRNAWLRWIF